jgi:L-cysteine:1D-myo-inositol 2-amino-2-deoxy-alpha-D-glucopyranoside ligase
VECCAIGLNRLGNGFDVQGGGSDLIFPHHEFSAAHAEALTGEYPMARHYVHTGMIFLNGEKMSKSKGNLVFVSRLRADRVDPMALRLALLSGHYRTDRAWTTGMLAEAVLRLDRWRHAVALPAGVPAPDAVSRLRAHLADDLDTPGALAVVDAWATATLGGHGRDLDAPTQLRAVVDALLGIAL